MDVIIVSHTEFGHVLHQGRGPQVIPAKSSTQGVEVGVKKLAQVADACGAKVTFAVMPEVVRSVPEVKHEIGLHVHPGWSERQEGRVRYYVGDAYLREHCQQSSISTVLRDYPFNEQLEMVKAGKDRVSDCLGVEPTVFVAGCWSVNDDTVKALLCAGFSHECSGVAHTKTAVFDWSRLPRICMPYHPHQDDYQEKGDLPLLIVPISQMLAGGNVNPELVPFWGLGWLKACFTEYFRQKLSVFHICLHSPSMTDPFFVEAMRDLLQFIAKHEVEFKYASEVVEDKAKPSRVLPLPYVLAINKTILMQPVPRILDLAARVKHF
jgi:hypothetical protein